MKTVGPHGASTFDRSVTRVSIACPARLHFGLTEICPGEPHLYGGLGVAVDEPTTRLQMVFASESREAIETIVVRCMPTLQERIERVLKRSSRARIVFEPANATAAETQSSTLRLTVDGLPDQHSGLGSGTQLACAVATLMRVRYLYEQGQDFESVMDVWNVGLEGLHEQSLVRPIDRLAALSGRGRRSYVGLAAHLDGGFIIDHGIESSSSRSSERCSAPESWPVILVTPESNESITGDQEVAYFSQCEKPNVHREQMWRLVREEIVPAIEEKDFTRFAGSLRDYGRYGGEIFAPVQRGIYRDAKVAALVDRLHELGLIAVGQSSWGPTVFGITETTDQAEAIVARLRAELSIRTSIHLSRMTNRPATLAWEIERIN